MAENKLIQGSSMLLGDNTIPGVKMPDELAELLPTIFKEVKDFGCDYFPTIIEMLTYDDMSEVASYGGFPVRYPHWKFGMEYEEMQQGYVHGMYRIYEMVINSNPAVIYCLDSNTLMDNVLVIAHALFHNDFFKNNIYFSKTNRNMLNQLANHGTRIRKYMQRWGYERVTKFIDNVLRIETLVDPASAWDIKKIKDPVVRDTREYKHPSRLPVGSGHEYMEPFINPKKGIDDQREEIYRAEVAAEIGAFREDTKDILKFIRDFAPLKPWQQDIVAMLYEESLYFAPQRLTKTANEGWASYGDYHMMCSRGLCGLGQKTEDSGIVEYAAHKMGVLGGKYSMNPYKLGFSLLLDIEERWNKGRFGDEYEECPDREKKAKWDLNLGLGKEKVFEIRKFYNDFNLISEFFTEDFCNKNEFFEWKRYPNGEYKIESRDHKKIKQKLLQRTLNGGLPDIHLVDRNHRGSGYLFFQHQWEGRVLHDPYVKATMTALYSLWNNDVYLASRDQDGNEIVYTCMGEDEDDIEVVTRDDYERGK